MKSIYAVLLAGFVLITFTNCGKKDGARTGSNEMSAHCYSPNQYSYSSCNSAAYSAVPGFAPAQIVGGYGGYAGYGEAVCTTNIGQSYSVPQPVYSPSKGAGCVDSVGINQNGNPVYYMLNSNRSYFTPMGNSGYYGGGYNGGYYGGGGYGAGSGVVLRACDTNDPCPSGQYCRSPFGPSTNAAIGICYY